MSNAPYGWFLTSARRDLERNTRYMEMVLRMLNTLRECEDVLDDYGDAETDSDGHTRCNRAMSLSAEVHDLLVEVDRDN